MKTAQTKQEDNGKRATSENKVVEIKNYYKWKERRNFYREVKQGNYRCMTLFVQRQKN